MLYSVFLGKYQTSLHGTAANFCCVGSACTQCMLVVLLVVEFTPMRL
jgi:hypothetical protein